MKKQNKKSTSIVQWMIFTNLASIVVVGIILTIMCGVFIYSIIDRDYRKIAETGSIHIASMLDELDDGEYSYNNETGQFYKGDVLITDEAFREIQKRDEDMRHTIF